MAWSCCRFIQESIKKIEIFSINNKYQIAADDKSQQLNQQPHGADL